MLGHAERSPAEEVGDPLSIKTFLPDPKPLLTPFGSPDRPRIFNSRMNLARRVGLGPPPLKRNGSAATPAQPSRDPPRRGFVQSDARADGPERLWLTLNVG